jgi:hypothetical protein
VSRSRSAALLLLPLLLATGCILPALDKRSTGRSLGVTDGSRVATGTVTKQELFDRLGPPMAIAGPGEQVEVPAANVHHVDEMAHRSRWFGGGGWTQQGDAWLEVFAARRPLRDTHRVYYWYETSEGGFAMFLLWYSSTRHGEVRELWVLVDEATGLAEDAVFRER